MDSLFHLLTHQTWLSTQDLQNIVRGGSQENLLLQNDLKDSSLLLSRGIYEAPTLLWVAASAH